MRRAEEILGQPIKAGRWCAMVTITPEQAKTILEEQPLQRPVSDAHVAMLMGEITAKRFILTHQGMACDEQGLLFDGQHRLWACFNTGVALTVWMFFNEPRTNFEIVDTRLQSRTNAQLAVVKGQFSHVAVAQAASSAARFIRAYDERRNPTQPHTAMPFSSADVDQVLAAHPGLPAMAHTFSDTRAARRTGLPRIPATALFTLFAEAHPDKAAIFLNQVLTGENLRRGDPALTLRESAAHRGATQRGRTVELTYRLARAWNHYVAGRPTLILYGSHAPHATTGRDGGRDIFPEIAGYTRPAQR